MRVDAGRGKLYDALKQVLHHWDEVDPHWSDQVRKEFEEKMWEPMVGMSEEVLRAMDRLRQVFTQCKNECQGHSESLV
jgi:hypothetical protein